MARARNIKPGFFANEYLAELSPHARLLFIGLWTEADREGRLEWRPKKIRAAIFPYEDVDIYALMDELEGCPDKVVFRYCQGDASYIQITNWHRHQKPHIREAESKIPAPDTYPEKAMPEHSQGSEKAMSSPSDSGFRIPDRGLRIEDSPSTCPGTTPPPKHPAGWEPTPETRDAVNGLLHKIESIFGVWPFSSKQIGNGEAAVVKEELAAILRLLSADEVVEIVRREMEARVVETKGVDRPVNLKWYMPFIKDAFFARDRQQEEADRRRDEEKKRRKRDPADDPVPIADLIEDELTEEDRAKLKERFAEVKQKIAKSRGSV